MEQLASPHAVPYVYVVGGQDYVWRVIRTRLQSLRVGVSGHAQVTWHPPFSVPEHTTHLLVVEDDCPNELKVHAERIAKRERREVVVAPARNKWSEAEELLKKAGAVDANVAPIDFSAIAAGAAPPETPQPEEPRTTLGDVVRAHAQELQVHAQEQQKREEEEMAGLTPQRLAERILRETKGKASDGMVAQAVAKKLDRPISADEVAVVRRDGKFPPAARGTKPQDVREALAKYGVKLGAPAFHKRSPDAAREGGKRSWQTRQARQVREPRPAPVKIPPAPVRPRVTRTDSDFVGALRAALDNLKEHVLVPFHCSELRLHFADGKWESPEATRVQVTTGKVQL